MPLLEPNNLTISVLKKYRGNGPPDTFYALTLRR